MSFRMSGDDFVEGELLGWRRFVTFQAGDESELKFCEPEFP
jgi:hypothetical protein